MASIQPRKRTEWRVVCTSQPTHNRVFKSEPAARRHAAALAAQGVNPLRVSQLVVTAWLARIRCVGAPDFAKTFDTRAEAEEWARVKEGDIARRQFTDHRMADQTTLAALLQRYDESVLGEHHRNHPDRARIRQIKALPFAQVRMSGLTSGQIASHRDARLLEVKGTTVKKELELISRVIALAMREWDLHLPKNPASGQFVLRPKAQPGDERHRRMAMVHSATPQTLEPTQVRERPSTDGDG